MSDNAAPILSREEFLDALLLMTWTAGPDRESIERHDAALRAEIQRLTEERDAARIERDRMARHWKDRSASAEKLASTIQAMVQRARQCVEYLAVPITNPSGEPFDELSQALQSMPNWAELSALRAELAETRERSNKNHDAALGFQNRALNAESLLASATDLMNTCAREWNVAQAANESGIKDLFDRLWSEMSCRYFDKRDDEAKANQDAVALRAELEAAKAAKGKE